MSLCLRESRGGTPGARPSYFRQLTQQIYCTCNHDLHVCAPYFQKSWIHFCYMTCAVDLESKINNHHTLVVLSPFNTFTDFPPIFQLYSTAVANFFTYSTARRRRRLSGRHMYMFSRHRKLHFCKIISFISGLECLQKVR